jgi:peptidoglycan/LPS O-acetylase OafA/YrhL
MLPGKIRQHGSGGTEPVAHLTACQRLDEGFIYKKTMTDKKNAFDLLRILLAMCVLVTHALLIGGYPLRDPLSYFSKGQTDLAEFGVMGFFALSGYLITASFDRTGNGLIFLSHRLLRIFPGFWTCLLVTAFVFAPLIFFLRSGTFSGFPLSGPESALSYCYHNFLLKINQWSLKDLLTHAAYPASLDGSLWSLLPELQCYFFTMLAGFCGLFHRNKLVYLVFVISIFIFFAVNFNFSKNFGPTVLILSPALKLYAAYLAGSLFFVFRRQLSFDKGGIIFLGLFLLVLIKFGGFHLISPLLIALFLLNLFGRFEFSISYDVSYGVYIYSFPVQQLLYQAFGHQLNIYIFVLLTVLFSLLMGLLSYLFIEKPFMNLRKKTDPYLLRRPERQPAPNH